MAALISLGTPDVVDRFAGWDGSRGSWLAALTGLRRRTDDQVFTAPAVAALSRLRARLGRRPRLIPTQLLEGAGSRVQLGPEQGHPGGDELTAKCCGQDLWTGPSPGYPSGSLAEGEQRLLSHRPVSTICPMLESADRCDVMDGMPGPLRADLEHLGTALDQVLAESGGSDLVTDVADLRRATIRLRQARGSAAALATQRVVDLVASLDLDRAERVAQDPNRRRQAWQSSGREGPLVPTGCYLWALGSNGSPFKSANTLI